VATPDRTILQVSLGRVVWVSPTTSAVRTSSDNAIS
jgi:hypothetical protein